MDKLLTATEVASILGISRSFSYQLIHRGIIPSVRIGRSVRVRPTDVESYIKQNLTHNEEKSPVLSENP